MALKDIGLFEQANRAIDRRDTDIGIDRDRAPVQFLDIGVINRFGQHPGYDPPLLGHFHALIDAPLFYARSHGRYLAEFSGRVQSQTRSWTAKPDRGKVDAWQDHTGKPV
jgi:hypothetical protein